MTFTFHERALRAREIYWSSIDQLDRATQPPSPESLKAWIAALESVEIPANGERAGFVTLARRPALRAEGTFDYTPVGSIWPTIAPVENHQSYCIDKAKAEPDRYGDVEYVIGRVTIVDPDAPTSAAPKVLEQLISSSVLTPAEAERLFGGDFA